MRRNLLLTALSLLLVSMLLWGCGSGVVATVNGKDITAQELDEEVAAFKKSLEQQGFSFEGEKGKEFEELLRANVLEQLIDQLLVMQEVERLNLVPSDAEVDDELEKIKQQLGSEAEYKKFLAANGFNEPKLKDMIKQQKAWANLQEKIAAGVPEPTEEEVKEYYDQNKEQFSQPEHRQVSHILIGAGEYSNGKNRSEADAKVQALQIVDKLKAGGDFAELARQYSDDPGSKENGGQYPPFSQGSGFAKEFEDAAFELEKGEYTVEPVRTRYGYHIIRLDDIIPASTLSLAEVKDNIAALLKEEAVMKEMDSFMKNLREKADIINKLEKKDTGQKPDGSESTKD